MGTFTHGAVTIEVDEAGFLAHPEQWSEEVAVALASTEGLTELSNHHWKIIRFLRNHYLKFGKAPMLRTLCKETGYPLKQVYQLFRSGPSKGACKVAGLPDGEGCV